MTPYDFSSKGLYLIKGEVGSGKTTLLRNFYLGKNFLINGKRCKNFFAYQSLDFPFVIEKTLDENLDLIKSFYSFDQSRLEELLIRLDLYNSRYQQLEKFSDGERLRAAIAIALAGRQPGVLLDEPTSRVDETTAILIADLIAEIKEEKVVVLVTHHHYFDQIYDVLFKMEERSLKIVEDRRELIQTYEFPRSSPRPLKRSPLNRVLGRTSLLISTAIALVISNSVIFGSELINPSQANYKLIPDSRLTYTEVELRPTKAETLYNLLNRLDDAVFVAKSLDYYLYKIEYSLNIEDYYRYLSSFYLFESEDESLKISADLYHLLQEKHGYFPFDKLMLGGLRCEEILDEPGLYLEVPLNYRFNFFNVLSLRSATPQDIILDAEQNPITALNRGEIALPYSEYTSQATVEYYGQKYQVVGYSLTPDQKPLVSSAEDFNLLIAKSDSYKHARILSRGGVSTSKIIFKNALTLDRKNYQNYLISDIMPTSLAVLISLVLISFIVNTAIYLLRMHQKKSELALQLYFLSAARSSFISLSLPQYLFTLFALIASPFIFYRLVLTNYHSAFAMPLTIIFNISIFLLIGGVNYISDWLLTRKKRKGLR